MNALIYSNDKKILDEIKSKGSFTIANSIEEWKKFASEKDFSFLVCDLVIPINEMVTLAKDKKLGIVASPSQLVQSNPDDNYATLFWLVPPFFEKELDLLLHLFKEKTESSSEEEKLLSEYLNTIFYKLAKIKAFFLLYKENKETQFLESLTKSIHKLAGSSGTYGFMTASDLSKKMETKLKDAKTTDEAEFKSYFDGMISAFLST